MGRVVSWTGHPFVDAGLAAIAAVAKVQDLAQLTPQHLEQAAKELKRVLLSDQSLGVGVEKSFAKSALSQLFPNSELVNPSNWKGETPELKAQSVRQKYEQAIDLDLQRAMTCLQVGGSELCGICGNRCPTEAALVVRKDKVPLLVGNVNFYPALSAGMPICGLCAFALRFLPMAVLRTSGYKRLWFLHTQSLTIAIEIAWKFGWQHFDQRIAQHTGLDFYGDWETFGDSGTVLYLLCDLLSNFSRQLRSIYERPTPTTAYLFSNDNRSSYVEALPIPNKLLSFFARLQVSSDSSFERLKHDLLKVPKSLSKEQHKIRTSFVRVVAERMLRTEQIIGVCLDPETPQLLGGWEAHRLYLLEVLGMSQVKLAILEQLGIQIAQSSDAKKRINELRAARHNELYDILLRYVREGWLKHDEFYTLLPPNDYGAFSEVRDILLAIAYEWEFCQSQGEPFPTQAGTIALTPDETLKRIQEVGEQLCQKLPNLSRWIGQLQTARKTDEIRRAYLSAVRSGAMGFAEFIFLAPLDDTQRVWLLRDYLLAFLFERSRNELPEEELITVGSEAETHTGGE
ncbi:MAG: type I-B CRISPR-associated protein Cas8b1/Cst1 [Armatimonadetes bacterium]|nr:type I-B CRISPR-associated protein Cas8b1/Cst1 [Armatimonadota bacterium]